MVNRAAKHGRSLPRRVLVTGATRGIGAALVSQLVQRGDCPLALGRWSTPSGLRTKRELCSLGCLPQDFFDCDLTQRNAADATYTAIAESGPVDGIISNAGTYNDDGRKGLAPDMLQVSPAMLEESFSVNTWAHLQVAQFFLPKMMAQGRGTMVIVASGMGRCCEVGIDAPAYRLSKSAALMLGRLLAARLEHTAVTVHTACPGWTRTRMGGPEAIFTPEQAAADILHTYDNAAKLPAGALIRHGRELACHFAQPSDRVPRVAGFNGGQHDTTA